MSTHKRFYIQSMQLTIAIIGLAVFSLVPEMVYAASTLGYVMCEAAEIVTGEVAAGIATIGVTSVGAAACFGRVSWTMAITTIAGIAGIFTAADLAHKLGATVACFPTS